jgi:hypothetical protein
LRPGDPNAAPVGEADRGSVVKRVYLSPFAQAARQPALMDTPAERKPSIGAEADIVEHTNQHVRRLWRSQRRIGAYFASGFLGVVRIVPSIG